MFGNQALNLAPIKRLSGIALGSQMDSCDPVDPIVPEADHKIAKWSRLTVLPYCGFLGIMMPYDVMLWFHSTAGSNYPCVCGLLAHIQLTASTADDSRWPIWTSKQQIEIIEALSTVPSRMLFLEHKADMKCFLRWTEASAVNCKNVHRSDLGTVMGTITEQKILDTRVRFGYFSNTCSIRCIKTSTLPHTNVHSGPDVIYWVWREKKLAGLQKPELNLTKHLEDELERCLWARSYRQTYVRPHRCSCLWIEENPHNHVSTCTENFSQKAGIHYPKEKGPTCY